MRYWRTGAKALRDSPEPREPPARTPARFADQEALRQHTNRCAPPHTFVCLGAGAAALYDRHMNVQDHRNIVQDAAT